MLKTSGGLCFGGEDGYRPTRPQPSGLDAACPMAVCSREGFRRIVRDELGLSGEGKGLCEWWQPLVGGRGGSVIKAVEGLWGNFGGQSCSGEARN